MRQVLTDVANELRDKGVLDEEESFIDATFAMAKGGGAEVGPTKRGKGMKIMAIVDRHGLPLSVGTHAANHHELRLVQLCFDFYMIEAKPETLIGDRAYDSDPLDDDLRRDGIEMVAPHRSNRREHQDTQAIHAKLDELLRAEGEADSDLPLWIGKSLKRSRGTGIRSCDRSAGQTNGAGQRRRP